MSETIEAIRSDLVRIIADLLIAVDDKSATAALLSASERIDVALVAMAKERFA
jgi:hypothetical protein